MVAIHLLPVSYNSATSTVNISARIIPPVSYTHLPLAAAGQVLTIIVRTITVAFQHAADKAADNGNLTAISWIHVSSLFLQAMRVAIPAVIVALSVGTSEVQNMLNAIPEVVTNGLNIAGGMIVVVGYAMVINMMRAGYLMPFFYLGFVTAASVSYTHLRPLNQNRTAFNQGTVDRQA